MEFYNWLLKNKKLSNWYLYLVTNVGGELPSIHYFYKPFGNQEKEATLFTPVATSYKVTIDLKKLGE